MAALWIRQDYPASDLLQRAIGERDPRGILLRLAIANALEDMSRAEAERLAAWSDEPARCHPALRCRSL